MGMPADILRMGSRNVVRNRRRSLITGLMIILGVAAIIFFRGYVFGLERMMTVMVVDELVGAMQVERAGYVKAQELAPLDLDLPTDASTLDDLRRTPGVAGISARLRFGALLLNGEDSTIVSGLGVDPVGDAKVCPSGPGSHQRSADRAGVTYGVSGAGLSADDRAEIVLANQLAAGVHAKLGDTVTLLAETQKGSMDAVDAVVVGIYRTGDVELNKRLVIVPLALAQRLLHMPGRATSWVLSVTDLQGIPEVAAAVRARLADRRPPVEVRSWRELMPYYRDVITLQHDLMGIVMGLFFVIMLAGIINTMLMSAFERQREVGTLMALGFRRRAIVLLFLAEAGVLGAVSCAIGTLAGLAIVAVTKQTGLPFEVPAVGVLTNHPQFDPEYVALAAAVAFVTALVAGLYPAWRASRFQPVEALRAV